MRADIEQVRQQKLSKFCQVILVTKDGRVVESCNSIFDVTPFKQKTVTDWFPFIESVFPTVLYMDTKAPELLFSKVENPSSFLPGYYDFTFSVVQIDNEEYVLWEVYDFTSLYQDFRHYQQKRNELEIQRQILAIQNKKLRKKEDIRNRENLVIPKGDKKETQQHSLDSTLSAITNFVTNNDKNDDVLSSLGSLSSYLGTIVGELPSKGAEVLKDGPDDSVFSLENVLYDSVQYLTLTQKEVSIVEASVAEDLPSRLSGNALDLKRIIVGLAINSSKLYADVSIKIHLYLEDKSDERCLVGIQVAVLDGNEMDVSVNETLLRLSVIKKIAESHQGSLEMDTSSIFGAKIKCSVPYLLV